MVCSAITFVYAFRVFATYSVSVSFFRSPSLSRSFSVYRFFFSSSFFFITYEPSSKLLCSIEYGMSSNNLINEWKLFSRLCIFSPSIFRCCYCRMAEEKTNRKTSSKRATSISSFDDVRNCSPFCSKRGKMRHEKENILKFDVSR